MALDEVSAAIPRDAVARNGKFTAWRSHPVKRQVGLSRVRGRV
jgi:hypothetical protein